ncbi:recombinase family protein [Crateriforma conspicua]|uniref:recombinase family protein n=1 Tax=Crateriforma conspicua TaxID=2527996 RepID=UPI0011A88034
MEDPRNTTIENDLSSNDGPKLPRAAAVDVRQSRTRGLTYSCCQNQTDLCRSLASQKGWTVATVFSDEGQSSETLDRPELSRLLGLA